MSLPQTDASAAHERLRDALIQQIQDGILRPGSAIPAERKLAERYQVSRHTVRQAIAGLEGFGLVQVRHGSGVYVAETVSDAAMDRISANVVTREGNTTGVVEVRRALEPYMTRLAAVRRDDDWVETLQALVPYRRESPGQEVTHEGTSFHREIARAAGNPVFDSVLRTLTGGPRRVESILEFAPQYRSIWEGEHQAIVDAIAARDPDAAEQLMAQHLDTVLEASGKYQLMLG